MIVPEDLAESVRYLLRLSPACVVPELVFQQGDALGVQPVPREAAMGVEPSVPASIDGASDDPPPSSTSDATAPAAA